MSPETGVINLYILISPALLYFKIEYHSANATAESIAELIIKPQPSGVEIIASAFICGTPIVNISLEPIVNYQLVSAKLWIPKDISFAIIVAIAPVSAANII